MCETYVYILADKRRGTVSVDTAADLAARVRETRDELCASFSARPASGLLLWYERLPDPATAETCRREMRKLKRAELVRFIETVNPDWRDISPSLRRSGA